MCLPSLALLFFLLAFYTPLCLFPSVDCSRLCPHQCICYEHANLVDCRERWFQHVPRGLPHATWLLELGGNNLSQIGAGAFAGLWSLRVLVLTNSQIQELQPQSFFPLSFLEKLDLSWNKLTSLPVDFSASLSALRELRLEHNNLHHISGYSLEYLDNMEKLDLSYNQLVTVGSGVFRGLSRLRHLYLHNNKLTVVQQGSLDMLPALEVLQLSNNNISYIENDALAPLYSLAVLALEGNNLHHLKFKTLISLHTTATHIQLSGNPWSCDCDLHRVFSKILHVRHLHIDDYSNVTCQEPPQLAGASLVWVDSQLCIAETATVLVITLTVLVTVVAAMVMAERNRKRNGAAVLFYVAYQGSLRDIQINPIVFNQVVVNQGSAYDNNTGMFTAPVSGICQFVFAAQLYRGDHNNIWNIMVNGNRRMACHAQVSGVDTTLNTCYYMEELKKGDKVWVKQNVGSCAWASTTSKTITFSSVLLASEGVSTLGGKYGSGSSCPLPSLGRNRDMVSSSVGRRASLSCVAVTLLLCCLILD